MNLDDLKSGWQQAGEPKPDDVLRKMMTKHPAIRRIRVKLVIESVALAALLALYYDAFDGDRKPLYANLLLIISALCYLLTDLAGLFALAPPDTGNGLRDGVEKYLRSLARLSRFAQISAFLYAAGLLAFFASVIPEEKTGFLLLAGVFLFIPFLLSARQWNRHLEQVRTTLGSFSG